jgi:hypothetical protein
MRGRRYSVQVELADLLDVIQHVRELGSHALEFLLAELETGEPGDV